LIWIFVFVVVSVMIFARKEPFAMMLILLNKELRNLCVMRMIVCQPVRNCRVDRRPVRNVSRGFIVTTETNSEL